MSNSLENLTQVIVIGQLVAAVNARDTDVARKLVRQGVPWERLHGTVLNRFQELVPELADGVQALIVRREHEESEGLFAPLSQESLPPMLPFNDDAPAIVLVFSPQGLQVFDAYHDPERGAFRPCRVEIE